jgi:hypothetical protein
MTTQALQVYYTSCKKGLSGYAGFQTRAESSGINLIERREIEAAGLYQAPRNLPPEPDPGTIAEQFPKVFKTVTLSSGRTAIVRSCYSGRDYSGRWGNYFAHTLVLDGGLDGRWPIDAYGWRRWVEILPSGAEEREPEPLPPVSMGDVAAGDFFSFDNLKVFLQEDNSRHDFLSRMLCAVFCRAVDSRSLVIREDSDLAAANWVACIQKAFPAACHKILTCCTFQFDPRNCQAINATLGETDFLFDETERKYQFYVFDFVKGLHSDVSENGIEYARTVSGWMASNPRRLEQFHEFAALFDVVEIGSDLIHLLRLSRLDKGEKICLAPPDIAAIVQFVAAHTRSDALERVLSATAELTGAIGGSATPEEWAIVLRYLAAGARSTGDVEISRRACAAWIQAFDELVIRQQRDDAAVVQLRSEVESAIGDSKPMALAFLADEHLDALFNLVSSLSPQTLRVLLSETARSCRELHPGPGYSCPQIKRLVRAALACDIDDLTCFFEPHLGDSEALDYLVAHMMTATGKDAREGAAVSLRPPDRLIAIGRSLGTALTGADPAVRAKLIRRLARREQFGDVLFGEWEAFIERSPDRMLAHESYERNMLTADSELPAGVWDKIAGRLLDMLDSASVGKQARVWVMSGRCAACSPTLAARVLSLAADAVGFAPEDQDSERLASEIEQELGRRKMKPDLKRVSLRRAVSAVIAEPPNTHGLKAMLRGADPRSYEEFAGRVLPVLLGRAGTVKLHRQAVVSFAVEPHVEAFRTIYAGALASRARNRFDETDRAALSFWMNPGVSRAKDDPVFMALRQPMVEILAERLAAVPKKMRAEIFADLKRHGEKQKEDHADWDAFFKRVEAKQPSLFSFKWPFKR